MSAKTETRESADYCGQRKPHYFISFTFERPVLEFNLTEG